MPGFYLYKVRVERGGDHFIRVEQNSINDNPGEDACRMPWINFGEVLPEPPEPGFQTSGQYDMCDDDRSRPPGEISVTVVGSENKRIGLGTYRALRVDAFQQYRFSYPKCVNEPQGSLTTSEWYVCGYGLIYSSTSHSGKYQGRDFDLEYGLELVSFTPISTNIDHVRYILADIQLGKLADNYRENIRDEETAEAQRRWEAGIRVENIEMFERKIIDGEWRIVFVGTENPVNGDVIILTSDMSS